MGCVGCIGRQRHKNNVSTCSSGMLNVSRCCCRACNRRGSRGRVADICGGCGGVTNVRGGRCCMAGICRQSMIGFGVCRR
jgi:hypothetical protein